MTNGEIVKQSIAAVAVVIAVLAYGIHDARAVPGNPNQSSTPASRDRAYARCDRLDAICRRKVKRSCKRIEARQLRRYGGYFVDACGMRKRVVCQDAYTKCVDKV